VALCCVGLRYVALCCVGLLRWVALCCVVASCAFVLHCAAATLLETYSEYDCVPGGEEPGRFYNFHVLAHTVKQIEWFGNLMVMSAARWETTHRRVKKLYRATRRRTRTLAACLTKAHERSEQTQWVLEQKRPTVTQSEARNGGGSDSDRDSDSDMEEEREEEEEKEEEKEEEREWKSLSKKSIVDAKEVDEVAKFTLTDGVAQAFSR
jgi:hypothetical protein